MKKITFLILVSLSFYTSRAQEKSTTDTIAKRNNWIIEGSVGHIKGVKPYSEGYFSSKTNGYFGQLRPNSFSLGARYIMSDIFSVKANVGLDIISNFNNELLPELFGPIRNVIGAKLNLVGSLKFLKFSILMKFK